MLTRRGDNVGVLLYFEALFIELIPASGWCFFSFVRGRQRVVVIFVVVLSVTYIIHNLC